MLLKPGQVVGSYEVERLIGEGGMGEVYRARHRILGSVHAVKVLKPEFVVIEDVRARFLAEARIQARLRHPHLVPVTDLVAEPGIAGLVMEWLDGEDLEDHQARVGRLAPDDAVNLAIQALRALAHIHENAIVHRDVKPANLFLEAHSGVLRLMDFGVAREAGGGRTTRIDLGTPEFMSPEQALAPAQVDARADLFSLACVLYLLLSGRKPFEGDSVVAVYVKTSAGAFPPLREAAPDVPPALGVVIAKALSPRPEDRYPTAPALAAALTEALARPAAPAAAPPAPAARPAPPSPPPTRAPPAPQREPRIFAGYDLEATLSVGRTTEVWRAWTRSGFEKRVVIKRLLPAATPDPRAVNRLLDEARIQVRLNDPNIVQVFDLGEADGRCYAVQEHVPGLDLARLLSGRGRALPLPAALFIATEVLRGLEALRCARDAAGRPESIVHGDLAPSNLLLSTTGVVKLTDFGCARVLTPKRGVLARFAGKPAANPDWGVPSGPRYMSPEQAEGRPLDCRSDLFSLAAVVHELLTGRPLFAAPTAEETLARVRRAHVPSPRGANPAISEELALLLLRALSLRPEDRYATAAEFLDALQRLVHREGHRCDNHDLAALLAPPQESDPAPASAPPTPPARLVVTVGVYRGAAYPIPASGTTIGRRTSDGIALGDPQSSIRHASLTPRAGGWWIEDRGSTNGTTINGTPAPAGVPRLLRNGDVVGIGATELRFEQEKIR